MRMAELAAHFKHAAVRNVDRDDSVSTRGKNIDKRTANPACSTCNHDDAS